MDIYVHNLVDRLINFPDYVRGDAVFSERLDRDIAWNQQLPLEDKVLKWSKEHPVIWNAGIGPGASFVPTLTRLLFEGTREIYGSYDPIIHVRLPIPSTAAASSSTAQNWLAFEVLTELATTLLDTRLPEDIKQLAAEESYFGYGELSDNLMLQAFGRRYINLFGSKTFGLQYINLFGRWDPVYVHQPEFSPIMIRVREALQGKKRHLLLVENLHVHILLDVLVFTMGERRASISQNRRWLISTTSKDVCKKSRSARDATDWKYHLTPEYYHAPPLEYYHAPSPEYYPAPPLDAPPPEYYHAPPFDDLRWRDWAVLITEALRDAARSIYMALQDKGYPVEFWLHVAQQCLYYGILYHPLHEEGAMPVLTSDELVRCWVAEDLLFSTAIPTNTPAATCQKQSNYYRSAYEAGKVVIQALQEYSLLPIYSVSTSTVRTSLSEKTTCSSSSQGAITGVSKLAENVPRLLRYELYSNMVGSQLRWVSFMNDHGRHVSWDRYPMKTRHVKMTSLILRSCSNMSAFPLDKLFTPHLHVLDLSYTPINSLPPSFSLLLNLYMLSLRGCTQLETLSPPPSTSDKETSSPLTHLENLQVLDMNGVPLLELTQQDGSNKSNLHYLDLSGSKFTTLPSEFFCEMSSLEDLIFGKCTNLKELPPSMAQLSNLLVLHVEGTQITSFPEHLFQKMQMLKTLKLINDVLLMSLPMSLSEAKGLKELHISNCASLILESLWELVLCLEDLHIQTWKSLENIKIHGHPTLRTFSLSGPWIRCLSLRGCSKLKIVNFSDDLTALEDVDLSGTDLEEVPHSLPNLPQLRMLLLLGVPYSMRFPWHQLVRFPKVFYLDHCANDDNHIPKMFCRQRTCGDGNCYEEETSNTAHININDPRIFHSFNADAANHLVRKRHFLQSFNIQVKPCSVRGMEPHYNEAYLFSKFHRSSTYRDIQYLEASSIMPMMKLQPMQRHVEISKVNRYPNGLRHILSVTNSVFIMDDDFVRSHTDLSHSFMFLEECQLQRCHQMTAAFVLLPSSSVVILKHPRVLQALPYLQILQVFDLNKILCLVEHIHRKLITLNLLKHIHLEHCPRLEKMFPCSLSLPALETLVILFCSNLKTFFYKQPQYEVAPSPLPNIKRIYLQELPQLMHIHDDVTFRFEMPKWEKLFVRGCQSFHHLPLLKKEYPKTKVEVSGEREWWDRLQLKLPEQSNHYLHLAPPEFVSRKKHIIESYLR